MHTGKAASLILISAASLAYEICLTRIFAVQQFHNFAFIVISLAVMGFAASGVAIYSFRTQPSPSFLASGFSLSTLVAYLIINHLPFDSYSIAWDRSQLWILLLYFTSAGVPFLCAGWFIGLSLHAAGEDAFRPYAANLIGASLGCLIALLSLQFSSEVGALGLATGMGFLSTTFTDTDRARRALFLVLAVVVFLAFLLPIATLDLRPSPYKPLSVAQSFPDARIVATERNASVRIDILESTGIHSYPGLSLLSPVPSSRQMGLFMDGDGPFPITRIEDTFSATFLQHMPSAIAYQLRPEAESLIIDPGTGLNAQIALALDAHQIFLPTDQPLLHALMKGRFSDANSGLLDNPRIIQIPRSSRGALSQSDASYTIVEWALSDPFKPITSGAFSLTESFLLTQEAFQAGWNRLSANGLLVITRWIGTPPSEASRAWSTLLQALNEEGLTDPEDHLVAFRGMRTATLLASKEPFSPEELAAIREFLGKNALDPIHLPGIHPSEVNQYNRLPEPVYFRLFQDLLRNQKSAIQSYDFRLEPTNDDQPFFFHFFRWNQSSEILANLGVRWQPFGGSGYFVLLAMLALMLLLAAPLVILPWYAFHRRSQGSFPSSRIWLYFGGLGAGFMLVEIPLILRMNLFLDYPVLSFGLVLFILLLTSGLGSLLSPRIPLKLGLLILIGLLFLNILLLPLIIQLGMVFSLATRVLIALLWLAPTGFLMGIPFAAGVRMFESQSPGLIPWAWAINGAFSGLSGVLATMALLDLGFPITLGLGCCCYAIVLVALIYRQPAAASRTRVGAF